MADQAKEKNKIARATRGRSLYKNKDDENYDPFELREVAHPTNELETLMHLLKGCFGSGVLAVPYAYKHIGLWFGLLATAAVGFICTYCVHILVKCSHIVCFRRKIPQMTFCDVAEHAFLDHPKFEPFAYLARHVVNIFLFVDLYGCCIIYLVFAARNVKQIADVHMDNDIDVRIWIVIFAVPMILICLIRPLKFLVPFSTIANILILISVSVTLSFIFTEIPNPNTRPAMAPIERWPIFFGTVIFALECIGVVMSLENNMRRPARFIGCPSVLCCGMGSVVFCYVIIGFFGYLKYGDLTQGAITLNLPMHGGLSQAVKGMIAFGIYFSYPLAFYVIFNIAWRGILEIIPENIQSMSENLFRVALVVLSGIIAVVLPNIGPFISILGALCLSILGLIMPSLVEIAVYHDNPGFGILKWRLVKNIFLICFGFVGLATGTYTSFLEFSNEFKDNEYETNSLDL